MDENTPTQLHIDFQTRRPTAIDFFRPTADQRAACTALNRERTRGILEAAQLTPSRESFPVDVWNAIFARKSKQKGVPLIPLERLGIRHDEDGMLSSDFLVALPSGAEANPYRDDDWNVVYKFFFLGKAARSGGKSLWKNRKAIALKSSFSRLAWSTLWRNFRFATRQVDIPRKSSACLPMPTS